jgi:S1-C subfamily serine protease
VSWDYPAPPRKRSRWRTGCLVVALLATAAVGLVVAWGRWKPWVMPRYTASSPQPVVARGALAQDEQATVEIFERAAPSVVYITNLGLRRDMFGLNVLEIPQGTGSGIVWDDQGHIVTNLHVIEGAQAAEVVLSDRSNWDARLVGYAADKDLAVLKIGAPRDKLKPILVGASHDLKVGQKVFAIGNPFGLDHTLTTGIISALGREIPAVEEGRTIRDVIQTDAAINPGNSGGPLLDSAGRLIGLNTAIFSPRQGSQGTSIGIGFAVPVDTINRVVPQLISDGHVVRPALGVTFLDERLARAWGLSGGLVASVAAGSGAAKAGVRPTTRDEAGRIRLGDLVVAIDRQQVSGADDVIAVLEKHKVGDRVTLTVQRGEGQVDLVVELQALS